MHSPSSKTLKVSCPCRESISAFIGSFHKVILVSCIQFKCMLCALGNYNSKLDGLQEACYFVGIDKFRYKLFKVLEVLCLFPTVRLCQLVLEGISFQQIQIMQT